jgi:hypothetical protein
LPQERKQLRKRKCTPQSSSFFFFTVATTILIEIDEEKSERERERNLILMLSDANILFQYSVEIILLGKAILLPHNIDPFPMLYKCSYRSDQKKLSLSLFLSLSDSLNLHSINA